MSLQLIMLACCQPRQLTADLLPPASTCQAKMTCKHTHRLYGYTTARNTHAEDSLLAAATAGRQVACSWKELLAFLAISASLTACTSPAQIHLAAALGGGHPAGSREPPARRSACAAALNKRNKFRSMRPGPTNMQSLPPVDVVVRYATHLQLPLLYEAWRTHVGGYACVALLWLGPSQAHGQASSTAGIAWCWGSVGPWGS